MSTAAKTAYLVALTTLASAIERESKAVDAGQATLQSYSNALSDARMARQDFIREKWDNERRDEVE